jgi:hypothetical protein
MLGRCSNVIEYWHEMSLQSRLRKAGCVNPGSSLVRACFERKSESDNRRTVCCEIEGPARRLPGGPSMLVMKEKQHEEGLGMWRQRCWVLLLTGRCYLDTRWSRKRITATESWCEVAGSRAREELAANESKWVGGCEDGVRKPEKV